MITALINKGAQKEREREPRDIIFVTFIFCAVWD
jgi:hypothetical protein